MDTTPDNLSPCAVCGEEVSSDYKCPGCSRSVHHFCGTRLGDKREDPRHGDPILWVGHKFTLTEIGDYIDRTGRHDSRLAWWAVHASSCILYQAVARPLLSVRVTGSMTVERVAKPLKNRVMTKERSRLSSEKSSMLLRVGLNLRFLQASKSKLWDSDDEWEKTPVPQTPQPARYYLKVKEAARRQQHFLYVSSTKTKTAERQVMKCNKSIIIASSLVLVVCCSLIYLVFIFYEMLMPSSEWVRSSNSKIEKPSCDRYKYKYNEV